MIDLEPEAPAFVLANGFPPHSLSVRFDRRNGAGIQIHHRHLFAVNDDGISFTGGGHQLVQEFDCLRHFLHRHAVEERPPGNGRGHRRNADVLAFSGKEILPFLLTHGRVLGGIEDTEVLQDGFDLLQIFELHRIRFDLAVKALLHRLYETLRPILCRLCLFRRLHLHELLATQFGRTERVGFLQRLLRQLRRSTAVGLRIEITNFLIADFGFRHGFHQIHRQGLADRSVEEIELQQHQAGRRWVEHRGIGGVFNCFLVGEFRVLIQYPRFHFSRYRLHGFLPVERIGTEFGDKFLQARIPQVLG